MLDFYWLYKITNGRKVFRYKNSTKLSPRSLFSLLVIIAFLVCGLACGFFRSGVPNNKPDSILIANYEKNKSAFKQLLTLLERDTYLESVTDKGKVQLNGKVTGNQRTKIQADIESRISEYTSLLNKIDVKRINIDIYRIELYVAGEEKESGKTVTGWSKGYRFVKNLDPKQFKVIDNLDDKGYMFFPEYQNELYFRQIDENWYLYLQVQKNDVID